MPVVLNNRSFHYECMFVVVNILLCGSTAGASVRTTKLPKMSTWNHSKCENMRIFKFMHGHQFTETIK